MDCLRFIFRAEAAHRTKTPPQIDPSAESQIRKEIQRARMLYLGGSIIGFFFVALFVPTWVRIVDEGPPHPWPGGGVERWSGYWLGFFLVSICVLGALWGGVTCLRRFLQRPKPRSPISLARRFWGELGKESPNWSLLLGFVSPSSVSSNLSTPYLRALRRAWSEALEIPQFAVWRAARTGNEIELSCRECGSRRVAWRRHSVQHWSPKTRKEPSPRNERAEWDLLRCSACGQDLCYSCFSKAQAEKKCSMCGSPLTEKGIDIVDSTLIRHWGQWTLWVVKTSFTPDEQYGARGQVDVELDLTYSHEREGKPISAGRGSIVWHVPVEQANGYWRLSHALPGDVQYSGESRADKPRN